MQDGVSGAMSCDVKQLHKMLVLELSTAAQGPSLAGHHQGILQVSLYLWATDNPRIRENRRDSNYVLYSEVATVRIVKLLMFQEVHRVLKVVVERNQVEAASHLSRQLFESWRQLVETALHAMLQDDIKRELKVAVLFELIQDLLIKVRT